MHRIGVIIVCALALVPLGSAASPLLELAPCTLSGGVPARCGTFRVAEDRARPEGRAIDLRVAVLPATGSVVSPDPLVYIAGGPGGSAVDDAAFVLSVFGTVNRARDIVLVDQRGTGGSDRLACPTPSPPVDPRNAAAIRAYVAACLARLGADVRQYTTPPAMDDLAEVIRALGYERANVYGGSYGATAAQYLLAQHPELVRTVILDGATLLDVPIFELWGRNGQRALEGILARCARTKRCANIYPRVRGEVFAVIAALRKRPVRVRGKVIDAATAAGAFQWLSRSPRGAAEIPWVAHRARLGDWTSLRLTLAAQEAADRAAGVGWVMYWSIVCNEPWARHDPARTAAASRGTYLFESTLADARVSAAVCTAVPTIEPPAWSRARVRSDTPVLIVVGGADPQDPLGNVAAARRELPNSLTVVVPGGGHGSVQLGCMPAVAQKFVERGSVRGLATACVRRYRPPPFAAP